MLFDVLTLFPAMFDSPFAASIVGKASERGLLRIRTWYLRDWAEGKHLVTDDTPCGGGDGMVIKPEPVARALRELRQGSPGARVVLLSPQGRTFCQADARRLADAPGLILVCGRYEGFDERIRTMVDEELSIGDYVLTGGELAAMVVIDAVSRYIPGVLGSSGSAATDSFSDGLLEHPHYTRPVEFEGMRVPDVLLSGNHALIARWRRREQLRRTLLRRPELLERVALDREDQKLLAEIRNELATEP